MACRLLVLVVSLRVIESVAFSSQLGCLSLSCWSGRLFVGRAVSVAVVPHRIVPAGSSSVSALSRSVSCCISSASFGFPVVLFLLFSLLVPCRFGVCALRCASDDFSCVPSSPSLPCCAPFRLVFPSACWRQKERGERSEQRKKRGPDGLRFCSSYSALLTFVRFGCSYSMYSWFAFDPPAAFIALAICCLASACIRSLFFVVHSVPGVFFYVFLFSCVRLIIASFMSLL